jgi:putative Mg2+ transporter-C (MgtC) family protein
MTPPLSDAELIQRLLLAALLGSLLGFERELRQKSAGLRTNTLIAIGSALFTLMSYELADAAGADPSRVAAQIVTGIGFLGAGAIMRTDGGVHGLTTAATIWVNAAVGVAAGGGEYHLAFIATGITLVVLLLLHPIEGWIDRRFGASAAPSAADAAHRPAAPDDPPSPRRR